MATIQSFEEIEAWQKARELARSVYACSGSGAFARDFDLRDQIRRAAVSILSNIAEGFERGGSAESIQFPAIANGSAGEVEAQLFVTLDQGYISPEQFEAMKALAGSTKRLISGFVNYLKSSNVKGHIFNLIQKPETRNHRP